MTEGRAVSHFRPPLHPFRFPFTALLVFRSAPQILTIMGVDAISCQGLSRPELSSGHSVMLWYLVYSEKARYGNFTQPTILLLYY